MSICMAPDLVLLVLDKVELVKDIIVRLSKTLQNASHTSDGSFKWTAFPIEDYMDTVRTKPVSRTTNAFERKRTNVFEYRVPAHQNPTIPIFSKKRIKSRVTGKSISAL